MRSVLALLVALSTATAAPLPFPRPKSPTTTDAAALQGEWVGVLKAYGGTDQGDGQSMAASISSTRITFSKNGEAGASLDFKLDPTKSPKHMDLKGFGSKTGILAVYLVKGDTLTLAYGGGGPNGRPDDLDGKKSGGWVLVFKRKR